jgi:hypothetical protein
MSRPFGWWRHKMSSSIIDSNIIQHRIKNRRTVHFFIDLDISLSRTIDLTKNTYGNLDFRPDDVFVKYYGFQSDHQTSHNPLAVITCDFINENDLLCPFYPDQSMVSFHNLRYTCKQNFDFRNTKIQVRYITGNEEVDEDSLNKGNLLVGLEFVRYDRITDF